MPRALHAHNLKFSDDVLRVPTSLAYPQNHRIIGASRAFLFTSYEDCPADAYRWEEMWVWHAVWQKEICPTSGRVYHQGYIELARPLTYNYLQRAFPNGGIRSRFGKLVGTALEARYYCTKETNRAPGGDSGPWEYHQCPSLGRGINLERVISTRDISASSNVSHNSCTAKNSSEEVSTSDTEQSDEDEEEEDKIERKIVYCVRRRLYPLLNNKNSFDWTKITDKAIQFGAHSRPVYVYLKIVIGERAFSKFKLLKFRFNDAECPEHVVYNWTGIWLPTIFGQEKDFFESAFDVMKNSVWAELYTQENSDSLRSTIITWLNLTTSIKNSIANGNVRIGASPPDVERLQREADAMLRFWAENAYEDHHMADQKLHNNHTALEVALKRGRQATAPVNPFFGEE